VVASVAVPITPGETFERYEVEALIGQGGMGEVYRATDTKLRRKVALKILRAGRGSPDGVARMFREARAAAALSHPNTIAIHDLGETDGTVYLVMEYVQGKSLFAYVGDESVTMATRTGWLVAIARALGAAHRAGVIHRDVKPSNVMISDEGVVKVLDFGLAKPKDPVSFKTLAGHQLGTPRYMAPEQMEGRDADARSDQYGLGVTAYELLTGSHPGPPGEAPLMPLGPGVPAGVARAVERALAKDPADRFATTDELADALEEALKTDDASTSPAADVDAKVDTGAATLPEPQGDDTAPDPKADDTAPEPKGDATPIVQVAAATPKTLPLGATQKSPRPKPSNEVVSTMVSVEKPPELVAAQRKAKGAEAKTLRMVGGPTAGLAMAAPAAPAAAAAPASAPPRANATGAAAPKSPGPTSAKATPAPTSDASTSAPARPVGALVIGSVLVVAAAAAGAVAWYTRESPATPPATPAVSDATSPTRTVTPLALEQRPPTTASATAEASAPAPTIASAIAPATTSPAANPSLASTTTATASAPAAAVAPARPTTTPAPPRTAPPAPREPSTSGALGQDLH
jgi:serine/threonine protein kinase